MFQTIRRLKKIFTTLYVENSRYFYLLFLKNTIIYETLKGSVLDEGFWGRGLYKIVHHFNHYDLYNCLACLVTKTHVDYLKMQGQS